MSAQAKAAHPYSTRHQQRKESEPEDLLVSKLKRKRELRGAEGGDDSDYLEESDVSQEEEEDEGCCDSKIEATKPGKKQQKSGKSNSSKSQKKRRVRYGWACSMCKFKHRSCDGQRPCNRCKSEGFADTCKDGPACNAVDIYQGKEPNLEFVKLKTPKDEEAETKPAKEKTHIRISHLGASSCAHSQCAKKEEEPVNLFRRREQEIIAKVARTVAIRAAQAMAGQHQNSFEQLPRSHTAPAMFPAENNNHCASSPFLFQFLEPPTQWQPTPWKQETNDTHLLSNYYTPTHYMPQALHYSIPSSALTWSSENQFWDQFA